jgi:lysophospholipase L1-like esterase
MARRVVAFSILVGVADWGLMVARDQYGVVWLQPHDALLDLLFIGALIVGWVASSAARQGTRPVLLRLIVVTIATVLALGAIEGTLRFVFRNARSSGDARDFIGRRAAAEPIASNSLGFRDREIPPKSADRYRIIVIGDSITWGQGLQELERFTNLLQEFLGNKYEVFNFGLRAHNMPGHLEVLDQALPYKPDFILLQLFINDFETVRMDRPRPFPLLPPTLDHSMLSMSITYQLLNTQWVRLQEWLHIRDSYVAYMTENLKDPQAPNAKQAFGDLSKFFHTALGARVPVAAVLFPATDVMGAYGAHYSFQFIHDRVHDLSDDAHVTLIDLYPMFAKVKNARTMWVSPFDPHPNAVANRQAAYQIVTDLGPVWQQRVFAR